MTWSWVYIYSRTLLGLHHLHNTPGGMAIKICTLEECTASLFPNHSQECICSWMLLEAWLLKYVLWRNTLLHCFPITPRSVSAPGCSWRQGYYLHTPEELTISQFPNHSWECNCSPGCELLLECPMCSQCSQCSSFSRALRSIR